jgi:hypothetical protein
VENPGIKFAKVIKIKVFCRPGGSRFEKKNGPFSNPPEYFPRTNGQILA